jgi:hypothetical protein
LRNFVIRQFSFGEFIFRDPETQKEVCRAADLQALQQAILTLPDMFWPIIQAEPFLKMAECKSIVSHCPDVQISEGRGFPVN